jgi:hypothetical protein
LHPPLDAANKGSIEYLATPLNAYQESKTRFNDGACDAKGRFIAGTLAVENGTGGSLWSYGVDGEGVRLVDDDDISVSTLSHTIYGMYAEVFKGLERVGVDSGQQDYVLHQLTAWSDPGL